MLSMKPEVKERERSLFSLLVLTDLMLTASNLIFGFGVNA